MQGHTDNSGTPEHNKVLSEQRAEAVRAWLVQHGVAGRPAGRPRLRPGEAARAERHGRQPRQNRRVQFIILEKDGAGPPAPAPGAPEAAPGF